MPRYLTEKDIADFRAELCRVATERFARFGYEGVTMRQLAEALGCSPKTPYRYFKDKADILATVRAQAFAAFADALEEAAASTDDAALRARRVGAAYMRFAEANPHGYRIMFEIEQPIDDDHPELGPATKRAMLLITRQSEEMAKAGLLAVDPRLFGWAMWAATHGVVMLQQSGMLRSGPGYKEISEFIGAVMLKGASAARNAAAPANKTKRRKEK